MNHQKNIFPSICHQQILKCVMLFKNAFEHFKGLKLFLIPILLFFWISSIFEHFLVQKIEGVINSTDPSTTSLIGFGGLHLLNGILFPALVTILVLSRIRNERNILDVAPYQIEGGPANQLFIETLRSWGKTIWWFFALVLPGIYKFIAYSYVPFVVFLDSDYSNGSVDALKASEAQFRKRSVSTILVLAVFYFLFPIMLSSFLDSYKNFNETPLLALLVSALNGLVSLTAFLLLAEIYLKDHKEQDHIGKDRTDTANSSPIPALAP